MRLLLPNKLAFLLILGSFLNCNSGDNTEQIIENKQPIISSSICNSYDDTSLMYLAINLNKTCKYRNGNIEFYDTFNPKEKLIEKGTRHYGDTTYIFFSIREISNKSIICIYPYDNITGFKICNGRYLPYYGTEGRTHNVKVEEFRIFLDERMSLLRHYCDSLKI
jgi:hypothetical protein